MSFGNQPGPYVSPNAPGAAGGAPIKNWLVESILVTLFCGCWPIGLFAILSAVKVDKLAAAGDRAGALQAAAQAKKLVIINVVVGAVLVVFGCGLGILSSILSAAANQ
jgi:hypothetical protein